MENSLEKPENKITKTFKNSLPELVALAKLNGVNPDVAEAYLFQELLYLNDRVLLDPSINDCLPVTIAAALKHVIKNNLTFDPSANMVYVKQRRVKVLNDKGAMVSVPGLEVSNTYNAKLYIAMRCGSILDFDQPQVKFLENGAVESVTFKFQMPSGRWQEMVYSAYDFERWKRASHKQNSRLARPDKPANDDTLNYANVLYSSWRNGIDPEFAKAKAINHSLGKIGTNPNSKFTNLPAMNLKTINIEPSAAEQAAYEEDPISQHIEVSNVDETNPKKEEEDYNIKNVTL